MTKTKSRKKSGKKKHTKKVTETCHKYTGLKGVKISALAFGTSEGLQYLANADTPYTQFWTPCV